MIIFPNFSDYISGYKSQTNTITIRIYEYPNKNRAKHLHVSMPSLYSDIFVEMLQNIVKNKFTNLRIEQVDYNVACDEVNIWQLAWFINNIVESKRVLIDIKDPNNENNWIHTSVTLNDENEFNRLKEQINRFYDKDFDGIVD